MAYLLVSVAIDETHPDAGTARTEVEAQVSSCGGEWIHDSAVVVPVTSDSQLNSFLTALVNINGAFDPTFSAMAVQVPGKAFSFVTDSLTNAAAVTTIMGRRPVGA